MKRLVVGIHEAKTTFSKLVREVQAGNEVVVESHGKPVAKLVGYKPAPAQRKPGIKLSNEAIAEIEFLIARLERNN